MSDATEDAELNAIADERADGPFVKVDLRNDPFRGRPNPWAKYHRQNRREERLRALEDRGAWGGIVVALMFLGAVGYLALSWLFT